MARRRKRNTLNYITEIDIGYLASAIDFRGKLITKQNLTRKTPQFVLYIESKNLDFMYRICELTASNAESKAASPLSDFNRRACDTHCPTPHVHVSHDEYKLPPINRWTLTGAAIAVVMHTVLPYLMEGNQEKFGPIADSILINTPLTGQGSAAAKSSIRRLAIRGWALPPEFLDVMD